LGAIIIGVSVLLMIFSWQNDSPTNDEVAHIGAGYSYLLQHNMRLNAEHPPLVKDLAALPLLFLNLKSDLLFQAPVFWLGDITAESQWGFGHILLFKLGNNADQMLHLVRLPMLAFFILAGWFMFKWLYDMYGTRSAIIGLTLFSFSPTVLAHGGLVTTDMASTATILLSMYLFIKYLKNQTRKNLVITGLGLGIALSAKFSSLLLIPFFLIVALLYRKVAQDNKSQITSRLVLNTVLIVVAGFALIVAPLYLVNNYKYQPRQQARDTQIILGELYGNNSKITRSIVWLSDKPVLRLAGEYLLGTAIINQRFTAVGEIYFLGKLQKSVGLVYFPIMFLVKEALPWLIIIGLGLALVFRKRNWQGQAVSNFVGWTKNNFTEFVMLLWVLIYILASLNSHLKIGIRHLLPIYPFLIILSLGQFNKITSWRWKRIYNFAVPALLAWLIIDAFISFPHYIAYYNEIVGGSANGYEYAVDSNLDWGQDLKRLGQWTDENKIQKIEIDYFGWSDSKYYLGNKFIPVNSDRYKNAKDFQTHNRSGGWIAVSATTLFQRSYGVYTWLRPFAPTTTIGNSIYIWHF